jgi:hypothetical protein
MREQVFNSPTVGGIFMTSDKSRRAAAFGSSLGTAILITT